MLPFTQLIQIKIQILQEALYSTIHNECRHNVSIFIIIIGYNIRHQSFQSKKDLYLGSLKHRRIDSCRYSILPLLLKYSPETEL